MKSTEAMDVQYDEVELSKLAPHRLKALKTACYRLTRVFYCDCCREYHIDTDEQKSRHVQLHKNLDLISKVQSIKGLLV
ncbi:hypothetical protein 16Q_037 [Pseudomonas phage 16Q]|nr:hypothetical protein 16Q_037 [Pseudomonas phage 16Q]